MSRTIRKRGLVRRPFASGLVLLLTLSMTVPVWAVVFTNPAAITITDATAIGVGNPYPASITVSGLTGTISSATVTLSNINHTFPDDIDILLVGPTTANLILMSDAGGSDDVVNRTITFDDAAATSLGDGTTLPTGTFKPTNIGAGDTWPAPAPAPSANTTLAAAFGGTDPNGVWSLYVVDDLGADMGTIGNGWSLTIITSMNPATTFTNGSAIHGGDGAKGRATPYASTIVSSGLSGAITDVNVTLTGLNHLTPDDLDIVLVGPSGKRILLLSDAGGTTDVVDATVTFDDAGAAIVPDGGPLVTATVRPTNIGTSDTIPDLPPPYPNPSTVGSATLASVFNGTEANGTWSLYIVDDATLSAGTLTGGWSIDITAGGAYGAKRFTNSDFDGDGQSDVAVQRPSTNDWYWRESPAYSNRAYPTFGLSGDVLVPGDYDGDRKTDLAVFRPSTGDWHILDSGTSVLRSVAWGTSGDVPVPADYDGDGKYDIAVYRVGSWYILQSTGGSRGILWGASGDIPVQGHFEGTDGADFTVFRPSDKTWYILNNATTSFRFETFGAAGDTLVPADYDGDGKTDVAVWRGGSGDWYIRRSASTDSGTHWGAPGDVPVPGDYDGDSKADVVIWRPSTGSWYVLNSGSPPTVMRVDNWGLPADTPIARQYLPSMIVPPDMIVP